ncbi:hypothetical protein HOI18_00710 [Candidatus Uhrbacteria bacterium]|jgi:hypothetical protein|nr:hypothetical protein [Candidatus Uhrbacteria bacterium]
MPNIDVRTLRRKTRKVLKFHSQKIDAPTYEHLALFLPIRYAWAYIIVIVVCAICIVTSLIYVSAGIGVAAVILMMILVLRLGAKTPECKGNPFSWLKIFWNRSVRGYRLVVSLRNDRILYQVARRSDAVLRAGGGSKFNAVSIGSPTIFFTISHSPRKAWGVGWEKTRSFTIKEFDLQSGDCLLQVTDDCSDKLTFSLRDLLRVMPNVVGFTKPNHPLLWAEYHCSES